MAKRKGRRSGDSRDLTRQIGDLTGFSTDSNFMRPSNVADVAVNIMKNPDMTLGPRRGYQCQVGDVGGLGTGQFDNTATDQIETITLSDDGNLYEKLNRQIYLYYDGRRTGVITGASQANPCQILSVGHGLQTGAVIVIRNIGGMIELNNGSYTITVTGVNTFTLDGVDSLLYTPYTSGGDWVIQFTENRYLDFTIFTDPRYLNSNPGWSFSPWSTSPWGSPSGESITCNITVNRAAQINGAQTNTNTFNVFFGHEFEAGDILKVANTAGIVQERQVASVTATTITFLGLPVSVLANVYVSQFFDIPFRKGFDVVSPYVITTFIATITNPVTGIFGLEVAVNGDTNYPAAFIEIIETTTITSGSVYTIQYYYWDAVNKTVVVSFPGSANPIYQNSPQFENASMVCVNEILYIANGVDFPQKYDGQTVYRAGILEGVRPSAVESNAGSGQLDNGNYSYAITYEQVDALGHIVEGVISEGFQLTISSGPSDATVTVNSIPSATGWNTDGALSNGAMTTVYGPDVNNYIYHLIGVQNSPHTMKIGDTAYYNDNEIATIDGAQTGNVILVDSGHGVEVGDRVTFLNSDGTTIVRTITAQTATTVTVDGPVVTVADNDTMSTNKANLVFGDIAIVDGNQNDVTTIVVLTGHTVQINDIVSFTDVDNRVQRRIATAVGATSVTISGIAVSISSAMLITTETIRATQFYVRRPSTNTTPATLTNGEPISNNLRINIWRTVQNGSLYYLLTTLPNNSITGTTQTFEDTIQAGATSGAITGATNTNPCVIESNAHGLKTGNQVTINGVIGMVQLNGRSFTIGTVTANDFQLVGVDATAYDPYESSGTWKLIFSDNNELGIPFPDPIRLPNPPPVAKYLLEYGNQLLYAGGKLNTNVNDDNVFFSEGNQPESVPAATNFFTVPSQDDQIKGMGISGSTLVVGKNKSMHAVTGDLLTSQFQVQPIAPGTNIGLAAHASIASVGSLMYFLSTNNGVYTIAENQFFPTDAFGYPIPVSRPIDDIFRTQNFLPDTQYVLQRAVALNYTKDNQYLLFLPCEDTQTTQRTANANSVLLCYDYQNKDWFVWRNMNAAGGMYAINNDLYFQERRFSGLDGYTANLFKQHRFYRLIDYADHAGSLQSEWRSSWEDMGQPEVRKKFVICMLLINRFSDLRQFNEPRLTFYSYLDRLPPHPNTIADITTVNNAAQSGWSVSPWSYMIWSGYQDTFARVSLRQGTVAKSIAVGIKLNGINMAYKLAGFQLEVVPEFRKTFVR